MLRNSFDLCPPDGDFQYSLQCYHLLLLRVCIRVDSALEMFGVGFIRSLIAAHAYCIYFNC